MKIRQREVWSVCCSNCNEVVRTFNTEAEAEKRVADKQYFKVNICIFCGKIVCSNCMFDLSLESYFLPICKKCASEHTVSELKGKLEERKND